MTVSGQAIAAGYEWRQRLKVVVDPPPFPSGCTLAAHVRARRGDALPKASLTTANGGLVRVSDTEIDIVLSPSQTGAMTNIPSVVMDVVRTDPDPDQHLGFSLTIPVVMPVTRGL